MSLQIKENPLMNALVLNIYSFFWYRQFKLNFSTENTRWEEMKPCKHKHAGQQQPCPAGGSPAHARRWYLRGPGAGLHPGAELFLCDLAAVVPAVEQAERHRVLLPGEPARITKSLPARQGVSCTGMKTPLPLPARCGGC